MVDVNVFVRLFVSKRVAVIAVLSLFIAVICNKKRPVGLLLGVIL